MQLLGFRDPDTLITLAHTSVSGSAESVEYHTYVRTNSCLTMEKDRESRWNAYEKLFRVQQVCDQRKL